LYHYYKQIVTTYDIYLYYKRENVGDNRIRGGSCPHASKTKEIQTQCRANIWSGRVLTCRVGSYI